MNISRRAIVQYVGYGAVMSPISQAVSAQESARFIRLIAQKQTLDWFSDGSPTVVWGYNQPSITLNQFETTKILFDNNLSAPTSVHWHGIAVTNEMDGVSGLTQQPVKSGDSFLYQIAPKDAGTYWAHAHHETYRQLAMGLYMPVIVKEKIPYPVDDDLLFVADDWLINRNEQIDQTSFDNRHDWSHGGRMGNMLTVNRLRTPKFSVKANSRIRLRVLNAANSRIMQFTFPGVEVSVVAKDGQPLTKPLPLKGKLKISPAERFDLVVDIPMKWDGLFPIYESSGKKPFLAANWHAKPSETDIVEFGEVKPLPPNPLPTLAESSKHSVVLDMRGGAMGNLKAAYYQGKKQSVNELVNNGQFWTFNGTANMPSQPLLKVKVGDSIKINLKNTTPWPHAMHLHGHHFLAAHELFKKDIWQDTLLVDSRSSETIRFVATTPGKWLLHCHMIEHQVSGMVTFIEVSA